jgi:hypothetical protein
MPEHEARINAERLQKGDILLGAQVHEDRVDDVKEIFDSTGASGIKTG